MNLHYSDIQIMRGALRLLLLAMVATHLISCANRGIGPQGGEKDTTPPRLVKETPLNNTLNFDAKKIELVFDEYIQLDNVADNVIVSPPQQNPPEVKAVGKRLTIEFQEPLRDSTTYTIDFGNAICDFTEKNPLSGYVYSFATGETMDSLAIFGRVVNAEDLNPISGVVVGIHACLDDSALSTIPFTRICKTDSAGQFAIHNIHEGQYKLYGLQDVSRDFIYQPGEGLAFSDELVSPYLDTEVVHDTIWRDSIVCDTIVRDYMHGDTLFLDAYLSDSIVCDTIRLVDSVSVHEDVFYEPSDLLLWYFSEKKVRHYFRRVSRETPYTFRLTFSAPQDSMPHIRSLRPSEVDSLASDSAWVDWLPYTLWQSNPTRDTIVGWLTDSAAIKQETLHMEMTYLKSDSLYELQPQTDTLSATYRAPRVSAKVQEANEKKERERKLLIRSNASASFEVYDTLRLTMARPVQSLQRDSMHLFIKEDTTYRPIPFTLAAIDSAHMAYHVIFKVEAGKQYELRIDSAAFHDVYGAENMPTKAQLTVKSLDAYATLHVRMGSYNAKARIQLLSDKDEVVRELPARPEGTKFEYLTPKPYYMRLYIDDNGDGEWTTGDWLKHRQPEMVYYFPGKLNLRANWDFEETFDHLARPQLHAKPKELRKDIGAKKK